MRSLYSIRVTVMAYVVSTAASSAGVRYVDINSTNPMPPYTSWKTAAAVIQDAVDVSSTGDEIVVADGVYETGGRAVHPGMNNRVAVIMPLTLRSVNGPEYTVIRGDDGPTRCVYLANDARIAGFTLTSGNAQWPSSVTNFGNGGGIWCESTSATASNCILVNNRGSEGGGVYRGSIDNCTLTGNYSWSGGGASEAILNRCTLIANRSSQGGGAAGSTLNNCLVERNSASQCGGGAMGGTLNNCRLISNSVDSAWEERCGGGAAYATLNNSLLAGNFTTGYGGGAVDSILNNCTVTGNRAARGGGVATGCMECHVTNSIIYYNTANEFGENYWSGGLFGSWGACGGMLTINYSCTTPLPINGSGNIIQEPKLASPSHITANSPCRGSGNLAYASGVDIDGQPWGNPPSMGGDEFQPNPAGLIVTAITASHTDVASGFQVCFAAHIDGNVSHSTWDFGDGTIISNRPYASHSWLAAGDYSVVLKAYNKDNPNGVSATVVIHVETLPPTVALEPNYTKVAPNFDVSFTGKISENASASRWEFGDGNIINNQLNVTHRWTDPGDYSVVLRAYNHAYPDGVAAAIIVQVSESVHYVSANNTEPVMPYTTPATAAATIQDAVNVALPGGMVIVSDGVYETGGRTIDSGIFNRVAVTKPLTLRSVNGPDVTVIRGRQPGSVNGFDAIRCVYLTGGAVMKGFTLTNGGTWSADMRNGVGGGVFCQGWEASVENCVLTGNSAGAGGGAHSGTLINCVLRANTAGEGGGGAAGSRLINCRIENNRARYGGGTWQSFAKGCVLSNNSAEHGGGGADRGTLDNCIITGNSALSGGGIAGGDVNYCVLRENTATDGGGASQGRLNNCVLTNNSAERGGGCFGSTLNNCTLTRNMATAAGGGTMFIYNHWGLTANNCILFDNDAPIGPNYHAEDSDFFIINSSCVTPLPFKGTGNITNPPLFVDAGAGDFRLQSNSPCINAGLNEYVGGKTDLDGNARIVGERVDMGAYEMQSRPPLSFELWGAGFGLSGASAAAHSDPDGDGFPNIMEFILSGNPSVNGPTEAPAAELVGGAMIFSFPRDDASESKGITLTVESGTDLATWSATFHVGTDTAASTPGVSVAENGPAPDMVTVTIPHSGAPRLFARLKATLSE
jgi:PKD repeat protein